MLVEQRENVERVGIGMEDEYVPFAGNTDDSSGNARGVLPDDGAVNRRIVAWQRCGRRPRVDRDARLLGEFDGLRVQDFRARLGELLRLLVGERRDALRGRD